MGMYGNSVYGLVNRIIAGAGRTEDIEECVSDVFLAAWRRIDHYDMEKGSLKTWILLLTKYMALDARRKLLRRQGEEELKDRSTIGESLEEIVISKEASMEMIARVNALTEPDRTIFYKRYFYYESVEQISIGLGMTIKAVENRLYRARKIFKSQRSERRSDITYG
ncbi:MAG: sigma-70 family RNA polymerase sigma factor [Gorillibacterium sp.]|nr:sigma-70 family RNA polymerase sigma factor [Gorillibacterium sp.]